MNDEHTLALVLLSLDDRDISSLSQVNRETHSLTRKVHNSPVFWRDRTQLLLQGQDLPQQADKEWRWMYYSLACTLSHIGELFNVRWYGTGRHLNLSQQQHKWALSLESLTCMELLLCHPEVEKKDDFQLFSVTVSMLGSIEATQRLLRDSRMTPSTIRVMFYRACDLARADLIELLLQDRLILTEMECRSALKSFCDKGCTPVVRILIADRRFDPSACESTALEIACNRARPEVVQLLLADGRADPAANYNQALFSALGGDRTEQRVLILKMLLADPRVNPRGRNVSPVELCCEYGYVALGTVLLSDGRATATPDEIEFICSGA